MPPAGPAPARRRVLPGVPRRWWRALAVALMLHTLVAGVLVAVVSIGMLRGPQRPQFVVASLLPPPTPAPTPQPVEPPLASEPVVEASVAAANTQSAPAVFAAGAAADARPSGGVSNPQDESVATFVAVSPPQADPAVRTDPLETAAPDADVQRQWESQVLAHLEKHKRYPPLAQQRRQQDRVLLGIRVDRGGQVLGWRVVDSAGYALLDGEAIDLAQRASPLPAPPDAVSARELDFIVAIDFQIENRSDALW